jgi:valyl-tRNA synthetase
LLNNIFLKQIWNATRLCIQKDFLPQNIEESLNTPTKEFDDFDVSVLEKLNNLYYDRNNIDTYEKYIKFFKNFKESIQHSFFSRYLEIQKVNPTKDVQFVCSYFFNFLLTILYPLVPEFVEALLYVSEKDFLKPIKPIELNKNMNYNMNILYNAFIKIKEMRIEYNIKQHEYCKIFIKSTPTI